MREFFEAFLFLYSILSTFIIYLLYKKVKSKVTKQDVENFLVDNFLDDEVFK